MLYLNSKYCVTWGQLQFPGTALLVIFFGVHVCVLLCVSDGYRVAVCEILHVRILFGHVSNLLCDSVNQELWLLGFYFIVDGWLVQVSGRVVVGIHRCLLYSLGVAIHLAGNIMLVIKS